MRVYFGVASNGDHYATTMLPVMGGHVRLIARVSDRELREMYRAHRCNEREAAASNSAGNIGFRLSFKSLGGAINAMAKPATLLKITAMAARLSAGDPTALLQAPGLLNDVKRGMAAKRVMAEAANGNPRAIAIMARARTAAATPNGTASAPGIDAGVMRYLVTVQRLARAAD